MRRRPQRVASPRPRFPLNETPSTLDPHCGRKHGPVQAPLCLVPNVPWRSPRLAAYPRKRGACIAARHPRDTFRSSEAYGGTVSRACARRACGRRCTGLACCFVSVGSVARRERQSTAAFQALRRADGAGAMSRQRLGAIRPAGRRTGPPFRKGATAQARRPGSEERRSRRKPLPTRRRDTHQQPTEPPRRGP
jgi:hypothetical protein